MPSSATADASNATAMTIAKSTPGWHRLSLLLLLTALIATRWIAHSSAGGLWRDEVHSVNLATAPTDNLLYVLTNNESFPVLWQLLLRSWITFFGSSDAAVRALGLLIGLAIIPVLWWMARQLGLSFPWWSMLLLGLDPSFIIFGSEARGYSLGIVTLLVLIGMSWNVLRQPTAWSWAGLTVAALLAVQSSYTNCFLLAATFIGCGVVAVYRGRYLVCFGFAMIGVLAAVTMLPYAVFLLPRLSNAVKPFLPPTNWWTRLIVFRNTLLWGGVTRSVVWCVVGAIAALEVSLRALASGARRQRRSESEQNLAMFTIIFCVVGTCGFWWYINFLGAHTANWYYLPYLTLLAVTTDIGMQLWLKRRPQMESWTPALVMLTSVLVCGEVGFSLPYRLTAVDLIARDLSERVSEKDLILVTPWYLGIPFDHYYRGPANWICLPDVDHDRQHNGYRELLERVMPLPPAQAIRSELETIDAVLLAGGTVWWVGHKPELGPGEEPLPLSAAPDPKYGWSEAAYFTAWQQLAIARMQAIGLTACEHPVRRPKLINVCEDPLVYQFQPNRSEPKLTSSQ